MKANTQAISFRSNDHAGTREKGIPATPDHLHATSGHSSSHIKYRSDIDGLRAIAVLSVVIFHTFPSLLPGGFIGVDVFFAISGYLITKIVFQEIEQRRFSFRDFYLRRIRRILPVFWCVLCFTVAIGSALLLPKDLFALLTTARQAAMFSANIYFAKRQDYFAPTADEQPLLHIWSLSVEEQFYLFWPALLLGAFFVSYRFSRQNTRLFALALTTLLLILSFSSSEYLLREDTRQAYFSLVSRSGELMIGSWVALATFIDSPRVNRWLQLLGIVGITTGLFVYSSASPFPGWRAILPTTSAALILYAGQQQETPIGLCTRVLSHWCMRYIGLLSYSLYLWHWPILAFMRYVYGKSELPLVWGVAGIALAFSLSALSYHLIEARTKKLNISLRKAFACFYVGPFCLILVVSTGSKLLEVKQDPMLDSFGTDVCYDKLTGNCTRGAIGSRTHVLLVGDSHAGALDSFVDEVGKHEGWSVDVFSAGLCSPVFNFDTSVIDASHSACDSLQQYLKSNYLQYDAVMIASYWAFQLGMVDRKADPHYLPKLERTLRVIARDRPVYIFSDAQRVPVSPLRLVRLRNFGLGENFHRPISGETQEANARVRKLAESIPNVHWIDLSQGFKEFGAGGFYDGKPTYYDSGHLNAYGARALARLIIKHGQRVLDPMPISHIGPSSK